MTRAERRSPLVRWVGRWLPGLIAALLSGAALALEENELKGLFEEGNRLFGEANEIAASDPTEARALYEKAALRFERIAREGGVRNGKLYYNIGNAYFRAEDVGRAILYYRKAVQFDPNDANIQQNLQVARSRRKDALEESSETKFRRTLLFWHYDLSFGQRFVLFGVAFLTVWAGAAVRLFTKRPFLKWVIGIAGGLSVALGVSLVVESRALRGERPGVVLAEEIVARKGDSESYEASFQEPLHAGAEFVLVEERESWLHVELPDGRRCWLPRSTVGLVR